MDTLDIPEDFIGRYFYEFPVTIYKEPPLIPLYHDDYFKNTEVKHGKPKQCGHNLYRFTSGGIGVVGMAVEATFTSPKTGRKNTTREVVTSGEMFHDLQRDRNFRGNVKMIRYQAVLLDADAPPGTVTGKYAMLGAGLWKRLSPAGTDTPSMSWYFLEKSSYQPREVNVLCDRCGIRLHYRAGESPSIRRAQDSLLPGEFAIMRTRMTQDQWDNTWEVDEVGQIAQESGSTFLDNSICLPAGFTEYQLCASCIPKGYQYCSECRKIHRTPYHSPALKEHREWIDLWNKGSLPETTYSYRWEDGWDKRLREPIYKSKTALASSRIPILLKNIGRATLCSPVATGYRQYLDDYLSELNTIWEACAERMSRE